MSANAYARIAERYQVPALDDEAIERFFLDVAPTLSREEREAIIAELRVNDLPTAPMSTAADLPVDVPMFSIDEAPSIVRPTSLAHLVGELTAAVEKRVSHRLDLMARAVSGLEVQMAELLLKYGDDGGRRDSSTTRTRQQALATGPPSRGGSEFVAPATAVEARLAELWTEVLGIDQVGRSDHFLDLGVDSFQLLRLMSRIREVFGVDLPITAWFDHPTIALIAPLLSEASPTSYDSLTHSGLDRDT